MLRLKGIVVYSTLVIFQQQWSSMEIKIIIAQDMSINSSLLKHVTQRSKDW